MNITKIKKFIFGKDAYLKSLKTKYKEEVLAFERLQDKLYNDEIKEYLEFIKEKCIEGLRISDAEKERIEKGLNEIKKASKEIKEYNDFIKYLALFSKVDFEDEKTEPVLYLFKLFYKLFKNKEIDLELYKENLQYYESINEEEIKEFYREALEDFSIKELPKDFYDDEEAEHVVFKILTEKNYEERQEYKKLLFSKLLKHYSNPSIIFNADFISRALLFNSYYLIYKVLNTKKYQDELSKIENKELSKELNEKRKKAKKEAKLKRHYHIAKTILILLFLAFLLSFGIAGKVLALLIVLYYALKGMLKGGDYISKDDIEGIKEQIEAEMLAGEDEEDYEENEENEEDDEDVEEW